MQALAAFIMGGQLQAALVAAATALLALLLFPPSLIVSGGAVVLVTLRVGWRAGLLLGLLAGVVAAALALPIFVNGVALAAGTLVLFWLPVCLLASVLRATVSLAATLLTASALGFVAVLTFYLILGDPGAWWLDALRKMWLDALMKIKPILSDFGLVIDEAALDEALELLAPFMAGLVVANLLAYMTFAVLLGRWWQSLLFNPGGFRQEFHALRLGRWLATVAIVIFVLVDLSLGWPLLDNLALVLVVVYALQGIAVVHGTVARAGWWQGWLVVLYVLMIFLLPYLIMLLCLLGVADAWVDVRARVKLDPGAS